MPADAEVQIDLMGGFRVCVGSTAGPGRGRRVVPPNWLLCWHSLRGIASPRSSRRRTVAPPQCSGRRGEPSQGSTPRPAGARAPDAVVLRGGQVGLFPSRLVSTDVEVSKLPRSQPAQRRPATCQAVASRYGGELLPQRGTRSGRRSAESSCRRARWLLRAAGRLGAATGGGTRGRAGLLRAHARGAGPDDAPRRCAGSADCAGARRGGRVRPGPEAQALHEASVGAPTGPPARRPLGRTGERRAGPGPGGVR